MLFGDAVVLFVFFAFSVAISYVATVEMLACTEGVMDVILIVTVVLCLAFEFVAMFWIFLHLLKNSSEVYRKDPTDEKA
jgi:hypothetical protein